MKSAISALIRRSVRTRNYRLPVLIPSYLLRSSSSNSSTDGGSSSGKSAGKDDSFVSAGNGPNNFPDAVNEVIDEVEVEKDGPKDNNNNNNRNVDFDDQFSDLSEIENILSLPSRSIDPKKKRHAILTEYEFFKYSGHKLPATMTEDMWKEASLKKTVEGRLNIYILFCQRENYRNQRETQKLERNAVKRRLLRKTLRDNFGIETPLKDLTEENDGDEDGAKDIPSTVPDGSSSLNSTSIPSETSSSTTSTTSVPTITSIVGHQMFITQPLNHSRMKDYHEHNLAFARNFGQTLFLDLSSLPARVAGQEFAQLLKDIQQIYLLNKSQWEPFDVHLCGYDHNNFTNWKLAAHPQCKDYNWDFTEKTPGQLFEKEKLVYITQRSPHRLREFRHDDVYVVDCGTDSAATMAKAEEIGCRTANVDHQRFFSYAGGAGLSLRYGFRDVFQWLIDARDTDGNWWYTLRRESTLNFRPEFAFAQQFVGFRAHRKVNKGWVETVEMDNNRSSNDNSHNDNSHNKNNCKHSHPREPSEKELEQLFGRSVVKPSLENTIRILQRVRSELQAGLGREKKKKEKKKIKEEKLVRDESSSCAKPLIQTKEAQLHKRVAGLSTRHSGARGNNINKGGPLNDVEFVLQELTRWQKSEKQLQEQWQTRGAKP